MWSRVERRKEEREREKERAAGCIEGNIGEVSSDVYRV